MTVCYFGTYDPGYSRNRVLIKGRGQNREKVIECRTGRSGLAKYIDLIKKHRKIRNDYDMMLVGFPGYQAVILARVLTRKKIIFDVFSSIYDSLIFDRSTVRKGSIKAGYYWLLDWLPGRLADKILLDTNAQIDYFVDTFKIKKDKFVRVFVGADMAAPEPGREEENQLNYFLVHFHGSYIPLQGVKYIIKAAELLKNEKIKFNIIGTKIKARYQDNNISNINFINNVPYDKLGGYMGQADVCLGIFGDTEKAKRVIPNKVYEALALGKAVITGDSAAVRELLEDGVNAMFCQMSSADDLAAKILELKNNIDLRKKIAANGQELFKNKLTPIILVRNLITELTNIK